MRGIAANMFDRGRAPAEVAQDLGVDAQTVRAWRRAYREGGRTAKAGVRRWRRGSRRGGRRC